MNTRIGFGALLWYALVSATAWAEPPLLERGSPDGLTPPGLLTGTRVELAARSYDLEAQALRVLVDTDGGTRLYLYTTNEESEPPRFGVASENFRVGPVLLHGLHRAVRSPTGHGPSSSVWNEATELRPDFSFEPTSRQGLELRYRSPPTNTGVLTSVGVYALEEAQQVPGVGLSVRHESRPYAFEAVSGVVRPATRPAPEDWFLDRRDFPGGYLTHSALSGGVRTGLLDAWAAGGLSSGPRVRPGGWGRGLARLHGQAAVFQVLGAVSSPYYRAPDGGIVSTRRYTDASLRIPGDGALSVYGGVASRFGQVPFSVHESATHRREFRVGLEYEGERLRLDLGAKWENMRDNQQERTRSESVSTRVETGAFAGDGLRGVMQHKISRQITAEELSPDFSTVTQLGLRYKLQALRLDLDATHRNDTRDSVRVRGAAHISYNDWSCSIVLAGTLLPGAESELPHDWSARLELRRVFRVR